MDKDYQELLALVKKSKVLSSAGEVLSWDMDVMMPEGQNEIRAQQMGMISSLSHDLFVDDTIGVLLSRLQNKSGLSNDETANVREISREYFRQKNVPSDLIKEITEQTVLADIVWKQARKTSDFRLFQPSLEKIVDLMKRYATAIDSQMDPYTVLLGEYEDDFTLDDIKSYFDEIKQRIVPLIDSIQ